MEKGFQEVGIGGKRLDQGWRNDHHFRLCIGPDYMRRYLSCYP